MIGNLNDQNAEPPSTLKRDSEDNEPAIRVDSGGAAPDKTEWTAEELAHLKQWYGVRDDLFLARELGCRLESLRDAALRVFNEPERDGPWTEAETDSLRTYLGACDTEIIGRIIGRSPAAVESRLVELATSLQDHALTVDEVVRFKRFYGTRSDEDLSIIFGRRLQVIRDLGKQLCLSKDKVFLRRASGGEAKTKMPRWTAVELDRLRELYPAMSNLDIAQELGRSVKSVVSKAHNLRLKKDKARLQQMGRQNVRLRYQRPDGEPGPGPAQGGGGASLGGADRSHAGASGNDQSGAHGAGSQDATRSREID